MQFTRAALGSTIEPLGKSVRGALSGPGRPGIRRFAQRFRRRPGDDTPAGTASYAARALSGTFGAAFSKS